MRQVYHVSYRLVFQMGRKKSPKKEQKSGSSHAGQNIGKFTADQMERCLAEIDHYKKRQEQYGFKKMEKSMNAIAREHGLSPATVNKRVTGKVVGLGSQLGGARRGPAVTAGKFQAIHFPCLLLLMSLCSGPSSPQFVPASQFRQTDLLAEAAFISVTSDMD